MSEHERRFRAIVEEAAVGIAAVDLDGRLAEVNRALQRLLGYGETELCGMQVRDLSPRDDTSADLVLFSELLAGTRSSYHIEKRYVRKDGSVFWARFNASLVLDPAGAPHFVVATIESIDERKRAEARAAAQYHVTRALAESATVEDAGPRMLEAVCRGLEWELGGLWLVDRTDGVLRLESAWTRAPSRFERFAEASAGLTFGPSSELPGRVWQSGKPGWIEDVGADASSRRARWATESGLRSAFAAPVAAGSDVIGVLELYSSTTRRPDPETEALIALVGSQLGEFLWRMEAQQAVHEREERFRTLVSNFPGVVYRCAAATHRTMEFMGDAVREVTGYPASDFIGNAVRPYASVIHDDDLAEVTRLLDEAISRHEPFDLAYRVVRSDGAVRWVNDRGQPLIGPGGYVIWLDGAIFDVTEQRRSDAELARVRRVLDSIVDNLPMPLFLKEAQQLRYVRLNRAAEELFGVSREEVLGKRDEELFPAQAETFTAQDRKVLNIQLLLDVPEEPLETKQLGTRIIHTRKVPIFGESGEPLYVLGICPDITQEKLAAVEREQLLRRLEEQNERLRTLDGMKDEFVALVSHELRTPLTSIVGYLELLLEGDAGQMTEEQQNFISVIERNAQRLLRLVGDLLFVAQIEAGKLLIERGPVDLLGLARDCVEAHGPRAARKRIELGLEGDETRRFTGDRVRLAQLLDNLVSNAIKFTPEGGRVEVRLSLESGYAVLAVSDTGMGIPEDELDQLFQRFFRTSGAMQKAIQGTGLGLTITKAIAEAHGGSISVESDEAVGTTFVVRLPLASMPVPDANCPEPHPSRVPGP